MNSPRIVQPKNVKLPRSAGSRPVGEARLVTGIPELRRQLAEVRASGEKIGLVPTMGALHAGHLSLVEAARQEADCVVASVFVNPTQFGPHEDFGRYPRTLAEDHRALSARGVRFVFAPETAEMYPADFATFVDVPDIARTLEGAFRPGHFRGVATVCLKLFNIVAPDFVYFGQKDYQQSLLIRRMVTDLNLPLVVRVCPIVRDADGLALSSRNAYLSPGERQRALVLSRALHVAESAIQNGQRRTSLVRDEALAVMAQEPEVRLDYLVVADPEKLVEPETIDGPVLVAVAARVGGTRLIDNVIVHPS